MTIETDRFTQTLPVPLTEAERLERADLSSRVLQERDEIEARMKADASQQKANIAEKEAELRRLNEEIRNRRAYRPVDCERRFDYGAGFVRDIRLDTGEELCRRDMTHDERQRKLDLDKPPKQAKKAPDRDPELEKELDDEGAKMSEADAASEAAERVREKRAKRASKRS